MKFEIMCMGVRVGKASDGNGFRGQGDWNLFKCFYQPDKAKYAEFYLNINLTTKEAELKCKDGWYADILTKAFARAMRGA
jgi:hypothetical protein